MSFTVSINPTYLCNFRCNFCYLTEEQLSDKSKLDMQTLDRRLWEISREREITHVDVYGGEITLLRPAYLDMMMDIIHRFYRREVSVITNLSDWSRTKFLLRDDIDVSVSWDYTCRERWGIVLKNMAFFPKPIHLLLLASECMVNWSDETIKEVASICETMDNIKTIEIKPYSSNQANQQSVTFQQYEHLIQRWIELIPRSPNYTFMNEQQMQQSLDGTRNAWSDDHIYITPRGEFAVLEFDKNDNEYFLLYERFEDYLDWTLKEKVRVNANKHCSICPYLGHCLSEHLREVKNLNNSCNGFRFLLDWYAERLQT